MARIYEQHDKTFANVSAFVIAKDGERVATIALKFPKDGAGRLYAYMQWLGVEMVRGQASGGGYDKRSAAIADAVQKLAPKADKEAKGAWAEFSAALWQDGGEYWDTRLRNTGFDVWQAV